MPYLTGPILILNVANIEQVISSGALRYLGNDALKNQIGVLESRSIAINDRQEREQSTFLIIFNH